MPTLRYHLGEEKTPAVEIDWNARWIDTIIRAHGQLVSTIASRDELQAGRQFDLANGETLQVRQPKGSILPEVLLNGQPLYPPQHFPSARVGRASIVAFLVGGVQLFFGLRPLLSGAALDPLLPENWVAATLGATFLVLGALIRLRSRAAAVAAFVLLVLATIWGVSITVIRAPEQGVSWMFALGILASPDQCGMIKRRSVSPEVVAIVAGCPYVRQMETLEFDCGDPVDDAVRQAILDHLPVEPLVNGSVRRRLCWPNSQI